MKYGVIKSTALAVLLSASLGACSSSHKVIESTLAPLELQAMQTREFEADVKMVFGSIITVLQDTGYIVESADGATGFITAKSPDASKVTYNLLFGFGKKHASTRITAFVEPIGASYTKVRLNFVSIVNSSQGYGISNRIDTPIEDQQIYQNVFEKISEAIFIRQAIQGDSVADTAPAAGNGTEIVPEATGDSEE